MGNWFVSTLVWRVLRRLFYLAVLLVMWGMAYLVIFDFYYKYWGKWIVEDVSDGLRNVGFLIAVFLALSFMWYRVSRDFREERFFRAVGQLGNPFDTMKVSAVYDLEAIAEQYPRQYYARVVNLLCDAVKNYYPHISSDEADALRKISEIGAPVDTLGERRKEMTQQFVECVFAAISNLSRLAKTQGWKHKPRLELSGREFSDVSISYFNIVGRGFSDVRFRNVRFSLCRFSTEFSGEATFENCHFVDCTFMDAEFYFADFSGSKFEKCDISFSCFATCNFSDTHFSDIFIGFSPEFFERCDMTGAHFEFVPNTWREIATRKVDDGHRVHFLPGDFWECFVTGDKVLPTGVDQFPSKMKVVPTEVEGDTQSFDMVLLDDAD